MCSHLGRPKDGPEDKYSLKPVAAALTELLGKVSIKQKQTVRLSLSAAAQHNYTSCSRDCMSIVRQL
jgi:3-phosphoglycerate kinase